MTKQVAPRPEPMEEDEELTQFFDDFVDDAIEQEQNSVKKPRYPAKNTPVFGRPTTDGFRRIKKPEPVEEEEPEELDKVEEVIDEPEPAAPEEEIEETEEKIEEVAEEETPAPRRNPSVSNPGHVMDFVPNRTRVASRIARSAAAASIAKPAVKSTRVIKRTTTIIQNVPDFDDIDDLDNLSNLEDLSDFDNEPIDEDEMASALAGFAEAKNIDDRKNRYTADEYDDEDYRKVTATPPRRRADGYKKRNVLEYDDDGFKPEDDYDKLDDITDDFTEEPKPFNPDSYKKTVHRTPFLTSVVVEKRPLSPNSKSVSSTVGSNMPQMAAAPRKSYNIPAPVDRPLSATSKKSYKSSYEPAYESKEQGRSAQGKAAFTMSTPENKSNSLPVVFAVLGTIILGAVVGAIIYLAFFNK